MSVYIIFRAGYYGTDETHNVYASKSDAEEMAKALNELHNTDDWYVEEWPVIADSTV